MPEAATANGGVDVKPRGGRPRQYPDIEEFRKLKDEVRLLREELASRPSVTEGSSFSVAPANTGMPERDRVWMMLCGMANSLGYEAFNDGMAAQLFNNVGRMMAICDYVTANAIRYAEEQREVLARRGILGTQVAKS